MFLEVHLLILACACLFSLQLACSGVFPGAPRTHNYAFSGTTFRMVPGGVPGGPGVPGRVPGNLLGGSRGLVWVGFGRMFAEGENRKMARKWFRTHQKSPKNYQIVEQDMADPIFGVPGPGGAQKGRK